MCIQLLALGSWLLALVAATVTSQLVSYVTEHAGKGLQFW
jgi:hypothetical protein